MASADQEPTTQSVSSAPMLALNLQELAGYAADAWGMKLNPNSLHRLTGLYTRTVTNWWKGTTERLEFNTIGIWCNLFWCHPHELISWPTSPITASAVRRPVASIQGLLAAGAVPPIPVITHLPAQLASLEASDRSARSLLREANVSHFAGLESDATALKRSVLSRICKATGADVGDMLTVIFPPEANIPPYQPRMLSDLLAAPPVLPILPDDLQRAIAALPESDFLLLDLRYGLSNGQTNGLRAIGNQVNVSAESVRQHLNRIRLRLIELAPDSGAALHTHLPEPPANVSAGRARPREKK